MKPEMSEMHFISFEFSHKLNSSHYLRTVYCRRGNFISPLMKCPRVHLVGDTGILRYFQQERRRRNAIAHSGNGIIDFAFKINSKADGRAVAVGKALLSLSPSAQIIFFPT